MTKEEIITGAEAVLDDNAAAESIQPSEVLGIFENCLDYTDQEVQAVLQNNLLPSTTKAPTVDAVLAGLESVADDVQAQIDAGIAGVYRDAGNWDASGGTFPTETNTGEPIEAGDLFTVDTAGTLGGVAYVAGESFRALVNTPGQTASNWKKLVYVAGAATPTTPGIVTIASDSDVSTGTGSGMVNSTQLQEKLDNLPSPSIPALVSGSITLSGSYPELIYDINVINGVGGAKLPNPTGLSVGKVIYVQGNNQGTIRSYDNTSKISVDGSSSFTSQIVVASKYTVRFMYIGNGFWLAEDVNGRAYSINGSAFDLSRAMQLDTFYNPTTAPTLTELNAFYGEGTGYPYGVKVLCPNITGGARIYYRGVNDNWYYYGVTQVV